MSALYGKIVDLIGIDNLYEAAELQAKTDDAAQGDSNDTEIQAQQEYASHMEYILQRLGIQIHNGKVTLAAPDRTAG